MACIEADLQQSWYGCRGFVRLCFAARLMFQALLALLAVNAQLITHFVQPRSYVCLRTDHPVVMSGKLDDPAWAAAPWTDDFADIEGDGKPKPRFRTRSKMLWDDRYLYIGAEMEEPHVWANITQH